MGPGGSEEALAAERLSMQILLGMEAAGSWDRTSSLLLKDGSSASNVASKQCTDVSRPETVHFDLTAPDDIFDDVFDVACKGVCGADTALDAKRAPTRDTKLSDIDEFLRELDALAVL